MCIRDSIFLGSADPKNMHDEHFEKIRDEIGLHVEKLIKQMDNDDSKK